MTQIQPGDTVDVGQSPVGTAVEVQAGHRIEQTLVGAVGDRNRQRFLIEGIDVAADDTIQQPAQGALPGIAVTKIIQFLLKCGRFASRGAGAKATYVSRS